ncbi:hypothetical protein HDU87_000005 [Geranomyces variabilis]|uniref:Uncharacterized protein n=1 Tax=Geranomyces variabilis TaxID=109894 RepID=A0AAD5TRV4_9FUNG|nr:hypothetical protein HDU87_000005 [Geranomyces variabilis]
MSGFQLRQVNNEDFDQVAILVAPVAPEARAARTLIKGCKVMSLYTIILWQSAVRRTYIRDIPILLAASFLGMSTYLLLKYAAPRRPVLMRYQHLIAGTSVTIILASILVGLEGAFVPYALAGYDDAIFDSKIRHLFIIT